MSRHCGGVVCVAALFCVTLTVVAVAAAGEECPADDAKFCSSCAWEWPPSSTAAAFANNVRITAVCVIWRLFDTSVPSVFVGPIGPGVPDSTSAGIRHFTPLCRRVPQIHMPTEGSVSFHIKQTVNDPGATTHRTIFSQVRPLVCLIWRGGKFIYEHKSPCSHVPAHRRPRVTKAHPFRG